MVGFVGGLNFNLGSDYGDFLGKRAGYFLGIL